MRRRDNRLPLMPETWMQPPVPTPEQFRERRRLEQKAKIDADLERFYRDRNPRLAVWSETELILAAYWRRVGKKEEE